MKVGYWVVIALLGAFYLYGGGKKVTQSKQKLAPMMGWVDTIPMSLVRGIGAVEILGVAGLVLPAATGIVPMLALCAAIGFVVLQLLAAGLHFSRDERKQTGLNAVLIVLAALAVWLATAF
ncbi:DoxX family protein [Frankia sp. AgB1.9]|uniref:DoxX family protein n=1 Tax=unclassified Frankia TaxID=2632575 RepID=UPI0035A94AE0|nr:DoxX family protein [Frankia sp. AgW1.1]MBL7550973.1 DoxX family protein [Frankia sp. AgB1.9]